ncbi:MAG: hypothetical protein KKG00_03405 [Bacteroidetes bacterium]|nr:hypothetical protein [Bacteroidota bacterium]
MAFEATVSIDGGTARKLHRCSYSVSQNADYVTGKTTSEVFAGNVSLVVEGIKGSEFWKLAIHPTKRSKGKVVFKDPEDTEKDFKVLEFEDGAVVGYSESMDAGTSGTMTENVTISCKKLIVDGVSFEKKW